MSITVPRAGAWIWCSRVQLDNYTGGRTNCLIKTGDDHNLQKLSFDFTEKQLSSSRRHGNALDHDWRELNFWLHFSRKIIIQFTESRKCLWSRFTWIKFLISRFTGNKMPSSRVTEKPFTTLFDSMTFTVITRFVASAVGKIYKLRTERLGELEAPWLRK